MSAAPCIIEYEAPSSTPPGYGALMWGKRIDEHAWTTSVGSSSIWRSRSLLLFSWASARRLSPAGRGSLMSIGVQTGPPIGAQKGPPFEYGTTVEERALRCARGREGGARPEARAAQSVLIPACGGGSVSVLEAPAVIAGLDDVAMVGDAIKESGGHLGVAEHRRPLPAVNCVSPNARLVVMMTLVCS